MIRHLQKIGVSSISGADNPASSLASPTSSDPSIQDKFNAMQTELGKLRSGFDTSQRMSLSYIQGQQISSLQGNINIVKTNELSDASTQHHQASLQNRTDAHTAVIKALMYQKLAKSTGNPFFKEEARREKEKARQLQEDARKETIEAFDSEKRARMQTEQSEDNKREMSSYTQQAKNLVAQAKSLNARIESVIDEATKTDKSSKDKNKDQKGVIKAIPKQELTKPPVVESSTLLSQSDKPARGSAASNDDQFNLGPVTTTYDMGGGYTMKLTPAGQAAFGPGLAGLQPVSNSGVTNTSSASQGGYGSGSSGVSLGGGGVASGYLSAARALLKAILINTLNANNPNPVVQIAKNMANKTLSEQATAYLEAAMVDTTIQGKPIEQQIIMTKYQATTIHGEAETNIAYWKQILEENKQLGKQTHDLAKRA